MVQFLVDELKADIFKSGRFNWKGIDYEEALPLFVAILSDCTSNQYFINFIVSKTLIDVKAAVSILKCFAKFNKKSQAEKIKMVELMGAAYSFPLQGVRELDGIYLGIHCWIFALKLRDLHSALSSKSSFLKTPTILSESAQKVFGRTTEFRTLEELHANRYQRNSVMLFQTQALLVIQRITSQIDPDPNPFFLHCLCRFLISKSSYPSLNQSSLDVTLLILELLHSRQWKGVIDYDWYENIVWDALNPIKNFHLLNPHPHRTQLLFDGFMDVVNHITDLVFQLQKHPDPLQNDKARKFVAFIVRNIKMFAELGKETSPAFRKWLADYIKFTNSHPGVYTVLHHLVTNIWSTVEVYSLSPFSTKIFQLFINGKADSNAQDGFGNTPLHLLAMKNNFSEFSAVSAELLLDVGAHLDLSNNDGFTPLDYLKDLKNHLELKGFVPDPFLLELTRTVLPLSCLSAQVIRQNSIPFENKKLPPVIISFIRRHSSRTASHGIKVKFCRGFFQIL